MKEWQARQRAQPKPEGPRLARGIHLVLGPTADHKRRNTAQNLMEDRVGYVQAVFRKPGCTRLRSGRVDQLIDLSAALPYHLDRDIGDNREPEITEPIMLLQQFRDEVCRQCHQRDR